MPSPIPTAKDLLSLMDSPTAEDRALVEKAYDFAAEAHKDHKRLSGEPYLTHLVGTAQTLARLGLGSKTVAAGLLHDSIEDVGVRPETIEKEFGKDIRFLVEGVTKLGQLKYHGAERHSESLRKLLVATSKDARVLIIKLADRLHNMRTLKYVPEKKRQRIALETLEIYAAIAHRLGMGVMRRDLEDLAFEYAHPEAYEETKKLLTEAAKRSAERLDGMVKKLKRALGEGGIKKFSTDYRVKGVYSFYRKLGRKENDVTRIHDTVAVRVVVEDVADCYRALGLVHELWQPLPNKIKDYIAFPKPNGYQSLHTTVFTGDGGIVEVQIRTKEMHEAAEFGIASHVSYKESAGEETPGKGGGSFDWIKSLMPGFSRRGGAGLDKRERISGKQRYGTIGGGPHWLEELAEQESEADFETALRTDLFSHRVFVFTPKGDVVDLPVSATPVDFAYAIHSDIGDHVFGANVNGKLVPLDTVLHNGDIVQIDTKKNARPTKKWLDFARTTLAKRHIRTVLEKDKNSH